MPHRITFYVAPALPDQSGKCRIVFRIGKFPGSAVTSYREEPELWGEAGLVDSDGKLVRVNATKVATQEIKESEPLVANLEFWFKGEAAGIPVEHEDIEELKKWGMGLSRIQERCHFCKEETRYWHKDTNTPVCPSCAVAHTPSEITKG